MNFITIVTSIYKPENIEDFVEDTLNQTIIEDCIWYIKEVGVNEPSFKGKLPDNCIYETTEKVPSIYETWNEIAKNSNCEYLANYNADDRSDHSHLEVLANSLDIYDDVDMVYVPNIETNIKNEKFEDTLSKKGFPCLRFDKDNYWSNNSAHARPMWRRSMHDRIGYFDESYKICADYEFWLRGISKGSSYYKASVDPYYLYFRNPEGMSTKQENLKEAIGEIESIRKKYGYIK